MAERCPQREPEQGQGQKQVEGQAEMVHRRAIHQSAGDHEPAHECLSDEKQSHRKVNAKFLPRDGFAKEKIKNRDGIYQPSQAGDETMNPFNVEDVLVLVQCHARINVDEFGRALVLDELLRPGLFADGRDEPANGIPLDDGKPLFPGAAYQGIP